MFDQKVTENASKVHAGGTDLGIVILLTIIQRLWSILHNKAEFRKNVTDILTAHKIIL